MLQISSGQEGGPELAPLTISEQEKLASMYELYQHLHKNVTRIEEGLATLEGINNAPHMWQMAKLILSELDRINRQLKGIDTVAPRQLPLFTLCCADMTENAAADLQAKAARTHLWRDQSARAQYGNGVARSRSQPKQCGARFAQPRAAIGRGQYDRRSVHSLLFTFLCVFFSRLAWRRSVGASSKVSIGAAPIIGSGSAASGAALSGPIVDWHQMGDSVDFKEFVLDAAELQKVDLNQLGSQKEVLAFWLNVFNIMVVHIHLENGPPTSSRRRRAMFGSFVYEIAFQQFSLEDIVEGIVRGNPKEHFKKKDPRAAFAMKAYDPRSHFGYSFLTQTRYDKRTLYHLTWGKHDEADRPPLPCSLASPPIRIFKPETLSVQLSLAAEQFLQENVSVAEDKRKIRLPYILKQYYQDFGLHETDVFRWLARYLDQQTSQEISASRALRWFESI